MVVPLAPDRLDLLDAGAGAGKIIGLLRGYTSYRPHTVTLGHNDLGDDDCTEIFQYLGSDAGRRHAIEEISLNTNAIGNIGLRSIAEYMRTSKALTTLFLQNVMLSKYALGLHRSGPQILHEGKGDSKTASLLAISVNQSSIRKLSLATNQLGDLFARDFFASLDSSMLEELHLSATGLTANAVPFMSQYLSSSRSRALRVLKSNGNQFGVAAVSSLMKTIVESNFSLEHVELYATALPTDPAEERDVLVRVSAFRARRSRRAQYKTVSDTMRRVRARNSVWRHEVGRAACTLLRVARLLLLSRPGEAADSRRFAFCALPPELKLHVLRFVAPALSRAQLARVYAFAADITTLPPLALPLRAPLRARSNVSGAETREERRERWLATVGCAFYEPEDECMY